MKDDARALILMVIERVPDWLRRELGSYAEGERQRADETLAGVIANALTDEVEV